METTSTSSSSRGRGGRGSGGSSGFAPRAPDLSLLAVLALILLVACGGDEEGKGREPADPPPIDAAEQARRAEAELAVVAARRLAVNGEYEKARAELRRATLLVGETTEVVRVSDLIREGQRRESEARDYEALLEALAGDAKAKTDEERLLALARAEEKARRFLETYPDSPHSEEIEAGRAYARRELDIHGSYVEEIAKAREHLEAGRHRECVDACGRALAVLDRPVVHDIRNRALEKLTPEGMVFIPAGFFLSGRDRSRTWHPAFFIDRTEVTNAMYHEFVKATKHRAPSRFIEGAPPVAERQRPVTWVTLEDALAYAAWAKKRLPTEREWERAARGTDGRAYPWGNEWDPEKGHFGSGGTLPVGTKPFDSSPDGVMDMGGNVMEMTLPLDDPKGERAGPVMKGGHWSDELHPEYALTFARYREDREHMGSGSGFRCVLPAK